MAAIIPLLFLCVLLYALAKKVNVYNCFTEGAREAFNFTLSLLPCLTAVLIMCELFEVSHLSQKCAQLLSPLFSALGIPSELTKLVLIKPFSGSASLGLLNDIIGEYGADSYIARCACVCYGSSETVFYISAVYFAKCKNKNLVLPVIIVLLATFISTVLACLLCRII